MADTTEDPRSMEEQEESKQPDEAATSSLAPPCLEEGRDVESSFCSSLTDPIENAGGNKNRSNGKDSSNSDPDKSNNHNNPERQSNEVNSSSEVVLENILVSPDEVHCRHSILTVDPNQDFRATNLKIRCFARPHMRAFHYSWLSFCIAFFLWFSIAPLLPEVRDTLELDDSDIWISNIGSVACNVFMRFIMGAVCDMYGARIPMGLILIFAAIPTAMTGLVNNLAGLVTLRFFIGVAGSSFVMCQCWSTRMFSKDIVGTANALVAGWGNAGGGLTQLVMGTCLFPLFRDFLFQGQEDASELAWRTVCIVPAVVAILMGLLVIQTSDDCPLGNYVKLKKQGEMPNYSATTSFRRGAWDVNTWILYLQYGACFGVELTMNNATATYFVDQFGLTTETASAVASIFGLLNVFARGLGGFVSDKMNAKMGMKGRLLVQMAFLILEGVCIFVFAAMQELWAAILVLTIFSIFVQGAEGSTFGIVPYVNPQSSGAVSGIVGAGGPSGAVVFGLCFLFLERVKHAYFLMGTVVLITALLSLAINIRGHGGIVMEISDREKWRRSILSLPSPHLYDRDSVEERVDESTREASTIQAHSVGGSPPPA